jgi:hypothetical protein
MRATARLLLALAKLPVGMRPCGALKQNAKRYRMLKLIVEVLLTKKFRFITTHAKGAQSKGVTSE